MTKAGYFAYQAKFLRRDLKAGSYQHSELPEVIEAIWRDDEDELRRAYQIHSLAELKSGIMAALPTKRGIPKKKAAKKKASKKAAKRTKRKSSWWFW